MNQKIAIEVRTSSLAGRSKGALMLFFTIAIVVLAGDLFLKWWSFEHVAGRPIHLTRENATQPNIIPPHSGIRIVPEILKLKLTLNQGAVFGMGQGGRWFFVGVTIVAIVIIMTIFWKSPRRHRLLHVALGLILAGALGNLYDRFLYGAVRDMLYLFPDVKLPFGWSWPGGNVELYPWIFNIADAALCMGVMLILLTLLGKPRKDLNTQEST